MFQGFMAGIGFALTLFAIRVLITGVAWFVDRQERGFSGPPAGTLKFLAVVLAWGTVFVGLPMLIHSTL